MSNEQLRAALWTAFHHINMDELRVSHRKDAAVIEEALAVPTDGAAPVPVAQSPAIVLDFKMASELLEMYGGEPGTITLAHGVGHSGKGLYAHYEEYPEEGAEFLGVPDSDAVPTPATAAAVPKPLDDPRLQELFSACIDGALTSGYQGVSPPPAGHWLTAWWERGHSVANREAAVPAPVGLTDAEIWGDWRRACNTDVDTGAILRTDIVAFGRVLLSRASLAGHPAVPAKLGDGATVRCRKCGEQTTIEFNFAQVKSDKQSCCGETPCAHPGVGPCDRPAAPAVPASGDAAPFQQRVQAWMLACFGEVIAADREERNHRFLEESLELVQACGCTASEAHQLVDYVYGRPVGEKRQEVGGVMVTLAALCLAHGMDMHAEGETELARIWTMVEKIRAKQAAKPKHSPLPTLAAPPHAAVEADSEHHGLDTAERVCFYEQDFYVLSNFSSFTLDWKGIRFDTSEAAYHWEKFVGKPAAMTAIQHAPSAHEAFKVAEHYKPFRRTDWDAVKVGIMRDILRSKAAQHEYVRRKLLATGDRLLVENSWRDDFWGWGPNRDGQNMLGKLWMEVRAELRAAARNEGAAG